VSTGAWSVLGAVALLAVVIFESRRQSRKYGPGSGTGNALMRAGLMELQNQLEPERKVEVLRVEERRHELSIEIDPVSGRHGGRELVGSLTDRSVRRRTARTDAGLRAR